MSGRRSSRNSIPSYGADCERLLCVFQLAGSPRAPVLPRQQPGLGQLGDTSSCWQITEASPFLPFCTRRKGEGNSSTFFFHGTPAPRPAVLIFGLNATLPPAGTTSWKGGLPQASGPGCTKLAHDALESPGLLVLGMLPGTEKTHQTWGRFSSPSPTPSIHHRLVSECLSSLVMGNEAPP